MAKNKKSAKSKKKNGIVRKKASNSGKKSVPKRVDRVDTTVEYPIVLKPVRVRPEDESKSRKTALKLRVGKEPVRSLFEKDSNDRNYVKEAFRVISFEYEVFVYRNKLPKNEQYLYPFNFITDNKYKYGLKPLLKTFNISESEYGSYLKYIEEKYPKDSEK